MEDYKRITLESYNKHASYFVNYFKDLFDFDTRKEFSLFVSNLRGDKILDLGCGGVDHALYFKEQGYDVTCVDFSQAMIDICLAKGLKAQVTDIEDLPFEENSFDGVWAVTSLLHVPKGNLSGVISKLSFILKPEGVLLICVKEGSGERMVKDKHDSTERFFAYWKKDELAALFSKSFDILEYWEQQPGDTKYLHFLLRNKKS